MTFQRITRAIVFASEYIVAQYETITVPVREFVDFEGSLNDTSGLDSRSQNILLIWDIPWGQDPVHLFKIAVYRREVSHNWKQ